MLELRNINKAFGGKQILTNFSLSIPEKQILAIVGPSGGGKTTLLRMLAGLETIDSGEIYYNGESLAIDELEKRNLLGFVFQGAWFVRTTWVSWACRCLSFLIIWWAKTTGGLSTRHDDKPRNYWI